MDNNNPNKPGASPGVSPVDSVPQNIPPVPPQDVPQAPPATPEPLTPSTESAPPSQDNSTIQPPPETPGPPPQFPKVVAPKQKSSKFPIIIGFLVVVAIAVYGFVAYLYFGNQKLKDEVEGQTTSPTQPVAQLPTPIPTTAPDNFEIDNGDVVSTSSTGEKAVIVAKDDYEDTGIIGFTNVFASPNNTNICFWSLPPALGPALYYSDADGAEVIKAADRSVGCVWSNAGNMFAYINDAATGSAVDIFVYSLDSDEATNLTGTATESFVYRRYEIDSWSDDDAMINCNYEEIDPSDTSAEVVGNCQVDVATSEVTDL